MSTAEDDELIKKKFGDLVEKAREGGMMVRHNAPFGSNGCTKGSFTERLNPICIRLRQD